MEKTEFINKCIKLAPPIAKKYNVDADELVQHMTAIAEVESRFNEKAQNKSSTARGIVQMLICTQREVEKKRAKTSFAPAMFSCKSYPTEKYIKEKDKLFTDVNYAIMLGLYELAYQMKRYKDWYKAVHSYNQGSFPGARKNDGIAYTKKVMKLLDRDITVDYATLANQPQEVQKNYKGITVTYKEFL